MSFLPLVLWTGVCFGWFLVMALDEDLAEYVDSYFAVSLVVWALGVVVHMIYPLVWRYLS